MYDSNNVANRIKRVCRIKGISVATLLNDVALGKNTMSNLKTSMPKADNLAKIADYLDCSVDYLLGRDEVPQRGTITPDSSHTPNKLKEILQTQNMSFSELSSKTNVDEETLLNFSKGIPMSSHDILMCAAILNCSVDDMLLINLSPDEVKLAKERTKRLYNKFTMIPQTSEKAIGLKMLKNWFIDKDNFYDDKIYILAKLLDCSIDYLIGYTDFSPKENCMLFFNISLVIDDLGENILYANSIKAYEGELTKENLLDIANNFNIRERFFHFCPYNYLTSGQKHDFDMFTQLTNRTFKAQQLIKVTDNFKTIHKEKLQMAFDKFTDSNEITASMLTENEKKLLKAYGKAYNMTGIIDNFLNSASDSPLRFVAEALAPPSSTINPDDEEN